MPRNSHLIYYVSLDRIECIRRVRAPKITATGRESNRLEQLFAESLNAINSSGRLDLTDYVIPKDPIAQTISRSHLGIDFYKLLL